jgi:hypothetical protein
MNDIFISYRRKDSGFHATQLCKELRRHLGDDTVFMDKDGIPYGEEFLRVIAERLSVCAVFLAVIGPHWSTARKGVRGRLFQPKDTVRLEILVALNRQTLLIPVLIAGATDMPPANSLPESIAGLAQINAKIVSDDKFEEDVAALADLIKKSGVGISPMDDARAQTERRRVEQLITSDLAKNRPEGPRFGQLDPDRKKFREDHVDDPEHWRKVRHIRPLPFAKSRGGTEPVLKLSDALGSAGPKQWRAIQKSGEIIFHAVGSTGNTGGPADMASVSTRMTKDFIESRGESSPSFLFHLGDVIYNFGEAKHYFSQFYVPYRHYPAPIFAIAGNHDGLVVPGSGTTTLQAFVENFCAEGFCQTSASRGEGRTAQVQPGVYFTLETPLVRILALYSNISEGPGVISDRRGMFPELNGLQLEFLEAALMRMKSEKFKGAVIIAVHHDPYSPSKHGGSAQMLAELDSVSTKTGIWPHAVLSGHAHNYQRYTRTIKAVQIPYIVAGNGGCGVVKFSRGGEVPAHKRLPLKGDRITLDAYDDEHYGYLRIKVDQQQLKIEYQPVSGKVADSVTVDLRTRQIDDAGSRHRR